MFEELSEEENSDMSNIKIPDDVRKPVVIDPVEFPAALEPLKQLKRFVGWKYVVRPNGKLTKVPHWAKAPKYPAKTNDPRGWGTYKQATYHFEKGETDGIGFVLTNTNFAAFDIDDCRDPTSGVIDPIALELVNRANSYAEITVSGTGLRVIGYGSDRYVHTKQRIPDSAVSIESYRNCERFITISGNQLDGTPNELADIDALIDETVEKLGGAPPSTTRLTVKDIPQNDNGLEFIEAFIESREKDGDKLMALIRDGDTESGDRSTEFFKAVRHMKDLEIRLPTAINILRRYPDGIAKKYDGRLEKETIRVYGKPDRDPQRGIEEDGDHDDADNTDNVSNKNANADKPADNVAKTPGKVVADPNAEPPRGMIRSSEEFLRDFVPPDYLLDQVCLKGFMYALTAPTGSGKTSLLMLLAMCVALGREFAGLEVSKGNVLYLAGENPDDVRMRWLAMAEHMAFDADDIDVSFIAGTFELDSRNMGRIVKEAAKKLGAVSLCIIDTGPAFFMGDNENDNVDMINHAKTLRSFVNLPGDPTVIAAMHPTKSATRESLLPRGGGAFLNEIDGNLTAWKDDMTVTMHWSGKHRGVDFQPMMFQLESVTARKLKDSRGRNIPTVIMNELSADDVRELTQDKRKSEDSILMLLNDGRKHATSLNDIADEMDWMIGPPGKQKPAKAKAQRAVDRLKDAKLVETVRDGVLITKRGRDAAERATPQKGSGKPQTPAYTINEEAPK